MAMAPTDLLTQCESAISACLLSQDYTTNGRRVVRAMLADLKTFRRELIDEINAGGPMFELGLQSPPSAGSNS